MCPLVLVKLTLFFVRAKSLGNISRSQIFFSFVVEHFPEWVYKILPYLPTKKYKYLKQSRDTIAAVAAEVMTEKRIVMEKGLEGGKDLMSLLLRANAREDQKGRLSEGEINAGIGWVPYILTRISFNHSCESTQHDYLCWLYVPRTR